jgi:PLP dependent protein
MPDSLEANLAAVRQAIATSAGRSGRDPESITLVAVTKTVPVERIHEAIAHGLRLFGENRVQEALPKIDEVGGADVDWHLIGHLQTNKVKFVPERFRMVQSVDSLELADALDRRLKAPLDVLIEVNVAEEAQKTGARPQDLAALADRVLAGQHLRLQGLMTVAPMVANAEEVRPIFRRLRAMLEQTRRQLGVTLPVLSMGMSDDYRIAVEEGATMLRLGRALFGAR